MLFSGSLDNASLTSWAADCQISDARACYAFEREKQKQEPREQWYDFHGPLLIVVAVVCVGFPGGYRNRTC